MSSLSILQVFADRGAENPTLSNYGKVTRLSINIEPNEYSDAVQCDANHLPLQPDAQFDIGWFHPPCGGASIMSETGDGSRDDWPDLIPLSREIADQHCNHHVIENIPRESLNEEVILTGHMFELGIKQERGFETSFRIEQPPRQKQLAETSPFFYTEKPHGWWAGVKGSSTEFPKAHLAKNTIPAAYINYIMRHHAKAVNTEDLPDYSNYNSEMEAKRRQTDNASLGAFQ